MALNDTNRVAELKHRISNNKIIAPIIVIGAIIVGIAQFHESFLKLFKAISPGEASAAVSDVAKATKLLGQAINELAENKASGYDKESLEKKKDKFIKLIRKMNDLAIMGNAVLIYDLEYYLRSSWT